MANTIVPGTSPCRKVITDECRENRGDEKAAEIVLREIGASLLLNLEHVPQGQGFKFHVVFTVERP